MTTENETEIKKVSIGVHYEIIWTQNYYFLYFMNYVCPSRLLTLIVDLYDSLYPHLSVYTMIE